MKVVWSCTNLRESIIGSGGRIFNLSVGLVVYACSAVSASRL